MRSFLAVLALLIPLITFSKNKIKVTVIGSGATIEEAKENALRSALEQVSGVYFSAYTELINNKIIKDEIRSITSGNIIKYSVLSKNKIDGKYFLTIKAIVSPNQFVDYIREKTNTTIFIDGDVYVANMKQKELDKKSENLAIQSLMEICENEIRKYYKYEVFSSSPSTNSYGNNKVIVMEMHVTLKLKRKFKRFRKYILENVKSFGIKRREIDEYERLTGEIVYENEETRSKLGVSLLSLILDRDIDDTYSIYTRNPIQFPSDAAFNFDFTDGLYEWAWKNSLNWECLNNSTYCKRIIGELENNGGRDALLKWPLPSAGEKNKITFTLQYSSIEFEKVKFFNLQIR